MIFTWISLGVGWARQSQLLWKLKHDHRKQLSGCVEGFDPALCRLDS